MLEGPRVIRLFLPMLEGPRVIRLFFANAGGPKVIRLWPSMRIDFSCFANSNISTSVKLS